ncbi:MAG: Hpt domain-containing protein [Leptospira sp.]|nr:Hpt domain-containing protein [Leptospira sp.]
MYIDWSRIESFVDGDSPEDQKWIKEMMESLKENLQEKIGLIKNHISSGNEKGLLSELHSVKGATANFGLTELNRVVSEAERIMQNGDFIEACTESGKIEGIWIETLAELEKKFRD